MFEARVCPAITMMRPVLSYLQKKDPADIFAEPVSAEDVSDSPLSSFLSLCVCSCVHVCAYILCMLSLVLIEGHVRTCRRAVCASCSVLMCSLC